MAIVKLGDMFNIKSGDYHAVKELDSGDIPLISCGDTNNGLVGFFDIPEENIYEDKITVAYNGTPLLTKYHPYRFGAKDDVGVLIPKQPMATETSLYIAALIRNKMWRFSFGRKCFRSKLGTVEIDIPGDDKDGTLKIDENAIRNVWSKEIKGFIPEKKEIKDGIAVKKWGEFNITSIFSTSRGDFHSLQKLDEGDLPTVSRVSTDNGIAGYYAKPDDAKIYPSGMITVSTVSADAFVQLHPFIATDNVILCVPKIPLAEHTLFFIASMINYQKWRYSYGRQCYKRKFEQINIYLPIKDEDIIDEGAILDLMENTPYWHKLKNRDVELSTDKDRFFNLLNRASTPLDEEES